jgi:hypothetical protein
MEGEKSDGRNIEKFPTFKNIMKNLNLFQSLAVVGLIFSAVVHIILLIIDKKVSTIWALYPTWIFVYIFGYIIKITNKGEDHSH